MGELRSVGDLIAEELSKLGCADHIEAEPGDFIADDGYLHCGRCGGKKEFRLPINGRMVPSLCTCGKAQAAADELHMRRLKAQQDIDELFQYSLIDAKFHEHTFDRFEVRNAEDEKLLKRARNYAAHFDEMYEMHKGMLLYGPPGTGKTFAADCIANALKAQGVPVLVTSIVKLTGGSVFGEGLEEVIEKMQRAKLLILDDLGAERRTSFKSEQIFNIIDCRVNSNKPMIITTNIDDFRSETDIAYRRIYDRIFSACVPIRVDGESRRRKIGMDDRRTALDILDGD